MSVEVKSTKVATDEQVNPSVDDNTLTATMSEVCVFFLCKEL
jgi:hypothetical protein